MPEQIQGSDPAHAPAPLSPQQLRRAIDALAEQVRRLPNGKQPLEKPIDHATLIAGVIALAELAAAEIRASAEREAAEIRSPADAAIGSAQAALARYREALGELAAQTELIKRTIATLREQTQLLAAERARIDETLRRL